MHCNCHWIPTEVFYCLNGHIQKTYNTSNVSNINQKAIPERVLTIEIRGDHKKG